MNSSNCDDMASSGDDSKVSVVGSSDNGSTESPNILSGNKTTEMLTDPEYTGQRYIINHEDLSPSELDELELFPGGLELPPMRSPRGSLHSIYGGGGSPSRLLQSCVVLLSQWKHFSPVKRKIIVPKGKTYSMVELIMHMINLIF